MIKNVLFIIISLMISSYAFGEASMRRCMLLPMRDSVDGAVAFRVFEDVESYLKESDWCNYRSNSEILNILSNFQKNLDAHLENPEVLKILSEKTKSGSLIKVNIVNQLKGVTVKIEIVGSNGKDVYFKEKTELNTDDIVVISQTVKNWLEVYEKSIPYNGRVIGVLGNQYTIDVGKIGGFLENSEVIITRATSKKRHPLLKEIVDWNTERIGSGKIFHVTKTQSQGRMVQYDTRKRLKIGDWVTFKKVSKENFVNKRNYEDVKEHEFGKLGTVGILFNVGSASATQNATTNKKISGTSFGLDLVGTVWATRKYWGGIEIGRKFGSLKQKEGTLTNSSNSLSTSRFKLKLGYKYLPLGFFYGPQIDAYFGYASYSYGLDTQVSDGWTEVGFKGILLGVKGSLPVAKKYRITTELGFLFNPKYSEETSIYGADDSASSFSLDFGGVYQYSPSMTIDGSFEFNTSKAKFITPTTRSLKLKTSALRVGTTFTF